MAKAASEVAIKLKPSIQVLAAMLNAVHRAVVFGATFNC